MNVHSYCLRIRLIDADSAREKVLFVPWLNRIVEQRRLYISLLLKENFLVRLNFPGSIEYSPIPSTEGSLTDTTS